jgi:hypothetical protein
MSLLSGNGVLCGSMHPVIEDVFFWFFIFFTQVLPENFEKKKEKKKRIWCP